jgi:hypothetical protein
MAYSVVPSLSTGDLWTAANANTYWRDNFAALWPYAAAGEIAIAASATTLTKIAMGAASTYLRVNSAGTAHEYGALPVTTLVTARQGGSATIWDSPGSSDYTPVGTVIQAGEAQIVIAAGVSGSVAITFPVAFTYAPLCFAQMVKYVSGGFSGGVTPPLCLSVTNTGFTLYLYTNATSTITANFTWLAIGI